MYSAFNQSIASIKGITDTSECQPYCELPPWIHLSHAMTEALEKDWTGDERVFRWKSLGEMKATKRSKVVLEPGIGRINNSPR